MTIIKIIIIVITLYSFQALGRAVNRNYYKMDGLFLDFVCYTPIHTTSSFMGYRYCTLAAKQGDISMI